MAVLLLFKALGEGERWVTVHPHGPGTEGQPVLIKPAGDGSYRVIGGAGGALNYLRLRGVKSEDSYKQEAKQRAQAKREEAKRQQARDREAGLTESRAKALEAVRAQVGDARVKLVEAVAQALGWKDQDLRFPVENFGGVSESARKAAEKKHAQAIMKKVQEAVDFQRRRLVLDAEARAQAGLGEVPLTSATPDQLSVQDLDPIQPATNGLGFNPDYGKRAGISPTEAREEARAYKPPPEPAKAEAQQQRKELGARIAAELATVRTPTAPLDPKVMVEARAAVDILKAAKEFRAVEGQARAKVKQVQAAKTAEELEPKGAAIVELDAKPTDADVLKGLAADLKTLRTRSFLDQLGKTADGQNLGGFVGAGAYNAVNSLSLAVAGQGMIDRSVVDVLGIAGAAQVMANRLRQDLTARELDDLTEAMQSYHVDHYMQASADALREAADLHEQAKEIELGEAANAQDLAAMQELNARRRDLTAQAQRALGTALGEMETNAALLWAMQQPAKAEVPLSLGKVSLESAVTQLRAIGLNQGDYDLDQVSGNALLTLKASGLDKLARPIDRADLDRIRDSQAIIDGLQDEPDWLPGGFANRPDLAMQAKPGVAPRRAKPFDYSRPVEQSVADYIGGRAADGDTPSEIMAGLLSEDLMNKVEDRQAFLDAVNAIAPLYGEDGKMVRAETYAGKFNKLADDFVERTYGADRTPLQKQRFAIDRGSIDALHRALAANPNGVAAFKPVGDLTAQDETALRRAFTEEYARTDKSVEPLRQKLAALEAKEPAKESDGLFGAGINPDWTAWKQERDQAAEALNKATMDWGKYVKALGSPQAAYASMQDVIRSKVLKDFAEAHNTLNPRKPLAIGKQAIANDLAHLDALDPGAREKRAADRQRLLDSLRTRVAGRYASGSVLDKEQAAREAERAQEQAQMGLFGVTDEEVKATAPALGERYSLGHVAEQQIAKMMPTVGANFRPGQPTKLFQPSMSGQYAARQRAIKLIARNKRMELGLGVGCVDGHTVLDDADRRGWTFWDWWVSGEAPRVKAWDGRRIVVAPASPVFIKGIEPMFRVTLANGCAVTVTAKHRFRAPRGWLRLAVLRVGDAVLGAGDDAPHSSSPCTRRKGARRAVGLPDAAPPLACVDALPASSSEHVLSIPAEGGLRSQRTPPGMGAYSDRVAPDGEPPPKARDSAPTPSPFPGGAHAHSHCYWREDGRGVGSTYSHLCPPSSRHSTTDCARLKAAQEGGWECHDVLTHWPPTAGCNQPLDQSARCSCLPIHTRRQGNQASERLSAARIVSIEPVGDRIVFDISVPDYHCYLADAILHHNSGKTGIALGAFTDLHTQGKVQRGLFAVPSVVVGEFQGTALTMLEPGKFKWMADPGADRARRIAAYKGEGGEHFAVVTHQAIRDDFDTLLAADGMTPSRFDALPAAEQRATAKRLLDQAGWHMQYLAVDEGHNLLNRQGKRNSHLANVMDAISGSTDYYVSSTADPVKNDVSEAFDVLQKIDPARYTDRAAFMRRYKPDTAWAKEGLQREFLGRLYTGKIDPGVKVDKQTVTVPVTPDAGQHERLDEIQEAVTAARLAAQRGEVDVGALKRLAPYAFAGVGPEREREVAEKLSSALGVVGETAMQRAINDGAKTAKLLDIARERKGKPGVVFVHYLDRVQDIAKQLQAQGHRVGTLTGADSSKAKDAMKRKFQGGEVDILVASDAGCVGANLQRGKWLVQYDQPMTAMVHAQRNGRIHRMGQTEGVELIDLVADHASERRAQQRLRDKYELREIMTSPMDGLDDHGLAGYINRVRAGQQASKAKPVERTATDVEPEAPRQGELAA